MKRVLLLVLMVLVLAGCGTQTSSGTTQEDLRAAYEQGRAEALAGSSADSDVFYYDEANDLARQAFLSGYDIGNDDGSDGVYDPQEALELAWGNLVSPSVYREQKEKKEQEEKDNAAFIAHKQTKVFHTKDCTTVGMIKEYNRLYLGGTAEELIQDGYAPDSCVPGYEVIPEESETSDMMDDIVQEPDPTEYTSEGTPINDGFKKDAVPMQKTARSSCFSEIGYDESEGLLVVTFRSSGASYLYYAVPEDVWEALASADSIGHYYNEAIKGEYTCEKLK